MSRLDAMEAAVGCLLVTTGVALWSWAAALITAGGFLIAFAVWPRRRIT